MKFIVNSGILLKQLQQISGVLNSSNTLPILDNFLLVVEKARLTVSASDMESTMTTTMTLDEGKTTGKIAIPAKILLDTLKSLPDIPLTFLIDDKTFGIEIVSENGKYKLSGFDGEEFPKVPALEGAESISIGSAILQKAINKSLFATGSDELRPVMSGVFFQMGAENVVFVATDAHRLVRYRRTDIRSAKETSFILPKKPLGLLKSNLPNTNTQVKIDYNEANAFFSFDNVNLICRLIDGRYPNYEAVIPLDNPNRLTIDRVSFFNAIRRVSIFSNKTTHQVKFRIAGSQVDISAEDVDFGNDANERLACSYDGKDLEIAFNARFISDMLNNLTTEHIVMELSLPNRAGLLSPPKEESDANEDLLMLVMPVMMN